MRRRNGEQAEQELIDRLKPWLICNDQVPGVLGVGDDCAILQAQDSSEKTVLTTDLLIEGTHFLNNADTNWLGVGAKAATANISDIASMGANPVSMLVGIGIPATFPVTQLEAIYVGLSSVANYHGTLIVGGDTTRAAQVTIAITVTGLKHEASAACRRSDARPGDNIYVTGSLGGSRMGLDHLLNNSDPTSELANLHYYRTARIDVGRAIAESFERVAMIDISDSLYNETRLISEASNVELELDLGKIPVNNACKDWCKDKGLDPALYALFSGEEYELLFTLAVAPEKISDHLRRLGVECPVTHLGTVNSGSGLKLLKDGHPVDPADETFVHFP